MGENSVNLPPGFRFYPSDEELVVHFLQRKAALLPCHPDVIPDLDLYPYDPWDLDGRAMGEGKKWYYYSRRTGNRVTSNGYWKAIGGDEAVFSSSSSSSPSINHNRRVGIKRYYAFYVGESPHGEKTGWIMQEFRLSPESSSSRRSHSKHNDYSKWVLCRVYDSNNYDTDGDDGNELSCLDEVFLSLDDLDEISLPH